MRVVFAANKDIAFTLTEVLISLAIIGVLAAITIPVLLQNMQEQELKTAFKKAYSDVAQTTQKVMRDNGGTMLGICPNEDHNCLKDKYAVHLNVIKNCNQDQAFGNCWSRKNDLKFLNGEAVNVWSDYPALVLNNGSFVRMAQLSDACKGFLYSSKGDCGFISIDVNGFKKPNIIGKDIFFIHIYKNGIVPWGVPDDDNNEYSKSANCSKSARGYGCAALVLQDKDY